MEPLGTSQACRWQQGGMGTSTNPAIAVTEEPNRKSLAAKYLSG